MKVNAETDALIFSGIIIHPSAFKHWERNNKCWNKSIKRLRIPAASIFPDIQQVAKIDIITPLFFFGWNSQK